MLTQVTSEEGQDPEQVRFNSLDWEMQLQIGNTHDSINQPYRAFVLNIPI